jgi:ribosomal protein S18 acetylase RimI-like enzyme
MSTLTVRQAHLSDLEELAVLFNAYRVFQGQAPDVSAARSFLQSRLDHAESVVFIAHNDSVPMGFAQLYPSYSSVSLAKIFILNDLFVDHKGRRKGVASKLLGALQGFAWSNGAVRVTLNVAIDNAPGQALYKAQGWRRDEQFLVYHRFPEPSVTANG